MSNPTRFVLTHVPTHRPLSPGAGPYYPSVTAGVLTLSDTDTGDRFAVSSGVVVVDDTAGNVARTAKRRLGPIRRKGHFHLEDA